MPHHRESIRMILVRIADKSWSVIAQDMSRLVLIIGTSCNVPCARASSFWRSIKLSKLWVTRPVRVSAVFVRLEATAGGAYAAATSGTSSKAV